MTISIMHTGDVHYSQKNLRWVTKAFAHVVNEAIARNADVAVLAGDLADHKLGIHEPAAVDLVRKVTRLAEAMPTLSVMGTRSHDVPGSMDVFRTLPTQFPIYVADKPVALLLQAGGWYEIGEDYEFGPNAEPKAGDAVFFAIPGINKAEPQIMEAGAAQYLRQILSSFTSIAAKAKAHGLPTTLVVHATIRGAITESGHAMVANDWEMDPDTLLDTGIDAIMAAHIHKQQTWSNGSRSCVYCSSPARLVHGDHHPHGFLMWDIEPGRSSFEFIKTPTRQLFEVDFDGPPSMEELAGLAKQAGTDDAVRIRWTVDQEYASTVDKGAMRELFAHCDSCKLEGTVLPIQSIRAPGISKAVTLEEKLKVWLETTGDASALDALIKRLDMLRSEGVETAEKRLTT